MIDFKNRNDIVPSALILLSIVILAATAVFMLLVPPPTLKQSTHAFNAKGRNLSKRTAALEAQAADISKASQARLWSGDAQTVTSAVLAQMTDRSRRYGVALASFRPQRGQDLPGLSELRFNAQVTGSYVNVCDLMGSLDASGGRIALTSVNIAASGTNAGSVTATLGLSAYMPSSTVVVASGQTGGANGQG